MDVETDLLSNSGHSKLVSSITNYLVDPNISVSDMIEKVEIKFNIFVIIFFVVVQDFSGESWKKKREKNFTLYCMW
jgi:hypothetical protein